MPRFFTQNITDDFAIVSGEDAAHMSRVLRMAPGDEVTLCDMRGSDYRAAIVEITSGEVYLKIIDSAPTETEPTIQITLFQAFPKGDKLEFIVQKAVELGVSRIVPVMTHRCVARPDEKAAGKRLQRCVRIAHEAAKQSGRGILPQVAMPVPWDSAVRAAAQDDCRIVFYEKSREQLAAVITPHLSSISIMTGPEGGFEASEIALAQQAGIRAVSLGRRILRCETAPLAALAAILYGTGNM